MKISAFPTVLMLIATAVISYLVYHIANSNSDPNDIVSGIGTGISVLLTLGCALGISFDDKRANINLKAWSIVAFLIMVIVNLFFAVLGVSMPYYVIILALLLVIHLWVVWKLSTVEVK